MRDDVFRRPVCVSESDPRSTVLPNQYLSMVAKSSASASGSAAMVSDNEDDDVKVVPSSSFFSKPSAMRVPLLPGPAAKVKAAAKPKVPRAKRRFDVYNSDEDEEEDEDISFLNDDSNEDDDDVVLSDDDNDQDFGKRKRQPKNKKQLKRVKSDHLEDELTRLSESEDEFEQAERILDSLDEEGESVSPKTMERIQRSDRQDALRERVLKFMNEGTTFDLQSISGVPKRKQRRSFF